MAPRGAAAVPSLSACVPRTTWAQGRGGGAFQVFYVSYDAWGSGSIGSGRPGAPPLSLAGGTVHLLRPGEHPNTEAYERALGGWVKYALHGSEVRTNLDVQEAQSIAGKVEQAEAAYEKIAEAAAAKRAQDGSDELPSMSPTELTMAKATFLLDFQEATFEQFVARARAFGRTHIAFWAKHGAQLVAEWELLFEECRNPTFGYEPAGGFFDFAGWQDGFWAEISHDDDPLVRKVLDLEAPGGVGKSNVWVAQCCNAAFWRYMGKKFPGVFLAFAFKKIEDMIFSYKGERICIFDCPRGSKAGMSTAQAQLIELLTDAKRYHKSPKSPGEGRRVVGGNRGGRAGSRAGTAAKGRRGAFERRSGEAALRARG